MEQIYPLYEEHIQRFCGMPVCVITTDGRRHIGILSHCGGGALTLNGDPEPQSFIEPSIGMTHIMNKGKKKAKVGKKAKVQSEQKAEIKSFYPYGSYGYDGFRPFGAAFAIDLALIAFLFLLI